MKIRNLFIVMAILAVTTTGGYTYYRLASSGAEMTKSAERFLATLTGKQRSHTQLALDTPKRVDWHFIPKDNRKGLQIKEMTAPQRRAALALLRSALSQVGYDKSTKIMQLETILHELEKKRNGRHARDPERYYFTIFGQPAAEGRWGLSVEGHHLSLNFVVDKQQVVASTPQFMGTNPGLVRDDYVPGIKKGTRLLAKEESLAFQLVNSFTPQQRQAGVISEKAPREIRNAGSAQPPAEPAVGLAAAKMTGEQVKTLRGLVEEYIRSMPDDVARRRQTAIKKAGLENIQFAWAGATQPGIGHYYRIQGPTFLIELVNTQPDAAGNPANHIHSVWRDPAGDFGIPVEK